MVIISTEFIRIYLKIITKIINCSYSVPVGNCDTHPNFFPFLMQKLQKTLPFYQKLKQIHHYCSLSEGTFHWTLRLQLTIFIFIKAYFTLIGLHKSPDHRPGSHVTFQYLLGCSPYRNHVVRGGATSASVLRGFKNFARSLSWSALQLTGVESGYSSEVIKSFI